MATTTKQALTYTPTLRAEQAYTDYYIQHWQDLPDPDRKGWWCLGWDIADRRGRDGMHEAIPFILEATAHFPDLVIPEPDEDED